MKRYRTAAGLAIASLCFLALYFLLGASEPLPDSASSGEAAYSITDLPVSQVLGIVVKGSSSYGIVLDGAGAAIAEDSSVSYDAEKLASLAYTACHLAASRKLAVSGVQYGEYGLDAPLCAISLILKDKSTIRFFLGRENPLSGERYARLEGQEDVFLISALDSQILLTAKDDLRDLRLFPALKLDEGFDTIEIRNGTGSFSLQKDPSSISGLYGMTAPVKNSISWETVSQKILLPLAALRSDHFVSAGGNYAPYALDKPALELTLTSGADTYRCLFSCAQDGSWYGVNPAMGVICQYDESLIEFLNVVYSDLLSGSLCHYAAADLARITLRTGTSLISCDISGSGDTLSALCAGQALDTAQTIAFVKRITALPPAERADQLSFSSSDALLTQTFVTRSGDTQIYEFYAVTDRLSAVSINGSIEWLTYNTALSQIIDGYLEVMQKE